MLSKYVRSLLPMQTPKICFLIFFEYLTLNDYSALWQEKVKTKHLGGVIQAGVSPLSLVKIDSSHTSIDLDSQH